MKIRYQDNFNIFDFIWSMKNHDCSPIRTSSGLSLSDPLKYPLMLGLQLTVLVSWIFYGLLLGDEKVNSSLAADITVFAAWENARISETLEFCLLIGVLFENHVEWKIVWNVRCLSDLFESVQLCSWMNTVPFWLVNHVELRGTTMFCILKRYVFLILWK